MTSVPERLAAAIANVPFVQLPEGWEGGSALNIPGLSAGLPLDDPWDSAEALEPLARALKGRVDGPFWAIAVPDEGDEWSAVGTASEVLELPDATGEEIEASRVGAEVTGRVDGVEAPLPADVAALLQGQDGDTAIVAHRFAGPVWVAEVYPL